jgi:hypothetical protein
MECVRADSAFTPMVPAHLAEVENPHISRLTHNRQWQPDEGLQGSIDHGRGTRERLLPSIISPPRRM